MPTVLALDQGTTGSTALVVDAEGQLLGRGYHELTQYFPQPGWVEHDPEEILQVTLSAAREALGQAPRPPAAIGITNQRETVVVWDRKTGRPLHRALVWQDRRTAARCRALQQQLGAGYIAERTGLVWDPYFSATKIEWLLDRVPDARARAERGELAFGTIDSFLLWRLTGGRAHATDATNASRTLLLDLHRQDWDEELLRLFRVPQAVLPAVKDSAGTFGITSADLFGAEIPVLGIAGDQQAATVGQACFSPGMIKSTYGTGCFALLNTGATAVVSKNRLLTTLAYRLNGRPTYAVEGAIFIAGAAIQWLRDGLGLIKDARESEALARAADPARRVYLVPAFTGLGAPHWDADARGALFGLTRDAGRAEIVRAALDACCFQTRDLLDAMRADGADPRSLRVDGGMVANDWLMQRLADLLGLPVERPRHIETTVRGAAALAGLAAGIYPSLEAIARQWSLDRAFEPRLSRDERESLHAGWQDAVARTLSKPR
jgi:glycerol kinase